MMNFFHIIFAVSIFLSIGSAGAAEKEKIKKEPFGKLPGGAEVYLYTLKSINGMEARITNYGGILVSLEVTDKNGKYDDIVLGFDSLSDYVNHSPYFGAIVGRYANRVAKGKFSLDGKEYKLAVNNGVNALHGGVKGFDKVVWHAEPHVSDQGESLTLTYKSNDGEEGYPGNLTVRVVYTVANNNSLQIEYTASTDKPTVLNLSHHSYFNLAGAGNGDILNHMLMINADRFTPVDSGLIPTGEFRPVIGTPMNFLKSTPIGERITLDDDQILKGGGYDHNWILIRSSSALSIAAVVYEQTSGRRMEVWTTEPGLQFYTGNFLDGKLTGKDGVKYEKRSGFCLETQHFPDSPNHPDFPSTILRPGQTYHSKTEYRFSLLK